MLRLDSSEQQKVLEFQKMHTTARAEGFGRLFRSPTVWEDLIKSVLLCNCGWSRTLAMNQALCAAVGRGAFPSPAMLVQAGVQRLQSQCGLGYRAKTLLNLAVQVDDGEVDLAGLEDPGLSAKDLYQRLMRLPGVGPFTAANMLQLLGHYSQIPCDSETVRHLQKAHKLTACTMANVQQQAQQVYAKYAPYQFLAYWHELWRDYEALVGPFADVDPQNYPLLTGHNMRKAAASGGASALLATSVNPVAQPQLAPHSLPAAAQASCSSPSQHCNKAMHTTVQSTELLGAQVHSMTGTAQDMPQESKPRLQSGSGPMFGAVGRDSADHMQPFSWQDGEQPCSLQQQAQQNAQEHRARHSQRSLTDAPVDGVARRTSLQGRVRVPNSRSQGELLPKKHAHTATQAKRRMCSNKDMQTEVSQHKSVRRSSRLQEQVKAVV
ncbi:hypothetical protein ABBQ32_011240 [Trebouxia sp. C0010 RCD-2024]